jgi:hypothetical protein
MRRIFIHVPNAAFHKIVRQYAQKMGRPIFTVKHQQSALLNYTFFASTRN